MPGCHLVRKLPEPSSILISRARSGMIAGMAKNQHAVALGRLGGLRGGPARARSMTPEKRTAVARAAANARWPAADRLVRVAADRLYRRQIARRIARRTGLDEGDLEHALFNMTLSPIERLSRGLRPVGRASGPLRPVGQTSGPLRLGSKTPGSLA